MAGRSVATKIENPCLGPSRILGLASEISTNDNLLHMPRHNYSVLVRKKCPPPSTAMFGARPVGAFCPPEGEKGVQHISFLFLEKNVFLGLHGICSMLATNQYQLIWQMIFHSVRSSTFGGVKTRSEYYIASLGITLELARVHTSDRS